MNSNKKICIITSDFRGDYNDDYVVGCEKEANYLGYQTDVFSMPQLSEHYSNDEECVYSLINYNNYAGVIYVARNFSRHRDIRNLLEEDLLAHCQVPIVTLGYWKHSESVESDSTDAFEMLTTHLIKDHNCQMIYFLGGDESESLKSRHIGFQRAFEHCGLNFNKESFLFGGFWVDCAEKLAKKIAYGQILKPDAVMCYNDTIAYALIKNLYFYGIRVPEDIIVTGFDGGLPAYNPIIPITTVSADHEYWGRKAVAILYGKMCGSEALSVKPRPLEITCGMSCGCGVKKPTDIRMRFELQDKAANEAMEFRNSFFEENAYSVNNMTELTALLKQTLYLIPDCKSMSVNVIHDNSGIAECIYLTQSIEGAKTAFFPASQIYPKDYAFNNIHNTHIIPLMFRSKFHGFFTVGYDDALVYGQQIKQYAKIVSNALEILELRTAMHSSASMQNLSKKALPQEEDSNKEELPDSTNLNPEVLLVTRNDITYKIKSDTVLYCEALDRKVCVVTQKNTYVTKMKLFEMEELLKSRHFVRISRSVLVNISKVTGFQADTNSTVLAHLITNQKLHVSRKYVADFKDKLQL